MGTKRFLGRLLLELRRGQIPKTVCGQLSILSSFLFFRSSSSLSYIGPADGGYRQNRFSVDYGQLNEFNSVLHRWQQKQQQFAAPGMAFGSMGIANVGLDPADELYHQQHQQPSSGRHMYRAQSMLYIDDLEKYCNRPPLSRPISTALILNSNSDDFLSPTFDRQSQFLNAELPPDNSNVSMRRAHSMNDLSLRFPGVPPDITLRKLNRQPFSYLPNISKNSLGAESDDFTRYKDVAL